MLVSPDSTRWETVIEKRQNKNELANTSQSIKTARDIHLQGTFTYKGHSLTKNMHLQGMYITRDIHVQGV